MSETNGTTSSGTESGKERAAHKGTFASLEIAQQVTPPSEKFRVFVVSDPAGKEVWTWAHNVEMALVNAARVDGYTVRVAEPKAGGPLTKERIGDALERMSDEDRAVLIAKYLPRGKGGKKS
jgi:hypothetical protein